MDIQTVFISIAISSAIVGCLFLPGIKIGLNLADEGYLQYGSTCLLKGQVPIRDFRAYDPGRYYWCAAWMNALGQTFVTQRLAMACIIAMVLTVVCCTVFFVGHSWAIALLATLLSFIWIHPYFKAFEVLFSLLAVVTCYFTLSDPGIAAYFLSGIAIGIAMFFGLNIMLYLGLSVLATLLLSLFIRPGETSIQEMLWTVPGLLLGLMPLLLIAGRYRGFLSAYWQKKVLVVLKRRTTNLPLPLPWIWAEPPQLNGLSRTRRRVFQWVFTLLPVVYLAAITLALKGSHVQSPSGMLLISSGVTGLVYLHHSFSRADISHLCQSIQPAVLLVGTLAAAWMPWTIGVLMLAALCVGSAWSIWPQHNDLYRFLQNRKEYSPFDGARETLVLPEHQVKSLEMFRQIIDANSVADQAVFFAPIIPGYYPFFNRQPVHYDVYSVYPADPATQRQIIDALHTRGTGLSIILNTATDANEKLRFSQTHSLVWQYLNTELNVLVDDRLPVDAGVFLQK